MTQDITQFRIGDVVELAVDKLALGGKGLARTGGMVVFVDGAIPGQRVRARIDAAKKRFAEARVVEVLEQSPWAETPFCPHFGPCGGCQLQNLRYEEQLRWKRTFVEESLRHIGRTVDAPVRPTLPSPDTRFYRNKMEFAFAGSDGDRLHLGLRERGRPERVLDIEVCFLQSEPVQDIVREAREYCRASGLPVYSARTGRGVWRFLIIREGKRTGDRLVQVITGPDGGMAGMVDGLFDRLQARFPDLVGLVHSVRRSKTQVAYGEDTVAVRGQEVIEEIVGGLRYRVSADAFFQTNTVAAEALYTTVMELGEFTGRESVLDLYAGSGGISLHLARAAASVTGLEIVQAAVADAQSNAVLNGITNCAFRAGDIKDRLREAAEGVAPDVVVTDPPRSGMDPEVVAELLQIAPSRILYVSCNPATLGRDMGLLAPRYDIAAVQPVDLFPHTAHVECVLRLDKRE